MHSEDFGAFTVTLMPDQNSVACSFSKESQRPKYGRGKLPGPGEYKLKPDLGLQMNSKRLNSPRASFPQAVKEQSDKVRCKPTAAG